MKGAFIQSNRVTWAIWAALLVVGISLYAGTANHPFVYDDLHSVKYNPHIRDLGELPEYFTDLHTFSSQRTGFMFRPVLLASYALNYRFGGQSPTGYRWVNLAIHLVSAGLCVHLARRLGLRLEVAAALGAAFLLHPAHAEVVNYISARSDSLAALLYLTSLWLALDPARVRGATLHLTFTIGLLVKSVAITLPALLSLWGLMARHRWATALRRHLGLWVLAFAYIAIQWANGFLAASATKAPRGLLDNIWTQSKALVYYPFLFAMPAELSVEHAFVASVFGVGLTPLLSILCLVSASAVALWHLRPGLVGWAWVWYLVTMAPYMIAPLNILVGERRAYLASGGLMLIGVWAWGEWHRRRPRLAVGWGAAFALCLGILTLQRNEVWASEVSLWEDAVTKAPANARAQLNLALVHKREGRMDEALDRLERGLLLNPAYADAWVALGDVYMGRGEAVAARTAFERALALNPDQAGVYHNLGNLSYHAGDPSGAVALFERALVCDPRFVEARNNLGQALEGLGETGRALEAYERAIADSMYWINTDDPVAGAWYNLARLRETTGQTERAVEAYTRAYEGLRLDSRHAAFAEEARQAAIRLRDRGVAR